MKSEHEANIRYIFDILEGLELEKQQQRTAFNDYGNYVILWIVLKSNYL